MTAYTLTTGTDTIVTPDTGATVTATPGTLNASDSLTGGAGFDVLQLVGSGEFRLDQVAHFTGFERIQTDSTGGSAAELTLNNQPITVAGTGDLYVEVYGPSDWNGSDVINGDATHSTNLDFNNLQASSQPQTYDLTSNTLSGITSVSATFNNITLTINSSDTAGVQSFSTQGTNDQLVTSNSALDLSHTTVTGFHVSSTNAAGTTYTVSDMVTAFQIAPGAGHDTLDAYNLTLTADQRADIFGISSIKTITDQTGTYSAPQNILALTSGNDTIVTPSAGSTVWATADTLGTGDSLTGSGSDTLRLVGLGTFRVDQMAHFSGFDSIKVDNPDFGFAYLTLSNQQIEIDTKGSFILDVYGSSNWNGSDVVNGDPTNITSLSFYNQFSSSVTQTYDLTSNTFSHVTVNTMSDNVTFVINSADAAGGVTFFATGTNDQLVTSDSMLDLSHTTVTGFHVGSTNAQGTTFIVSDLNTALNITGGPGHDTLDAHSLTLSATERATIFENGSIDTIIDQTGTYRAGPTAPVKDVNSDFNDNGKSDVLWVDSDGRASVWDNGQIAGAHIIAPTGTISNGWHFAGTGDFDNNGTADILWVNDNGAASVWNSGQIGNAHTIAPAGTISNGWHFAGIGDFDGSGTSDIAWVNDNGAVSVWGDGQIANAHIVAPAGTVSSGWHFAGTGDFDGNGKSDFLWVNDNGAASVWDGGQLSGAHIIAPAGTISSGWHFAGTGDFTGDGKSDILWVNSNGAASIWDNGQPWGAHTIAPAGTISNGWHFAAIGDYDGNGHDDILWHNDNGAVSIWNDGQISGAHVTVAAGIVPFDWHIV